MLRHRQLCGGDRAILDGPKLGRGRHRYRNRPAARHAAGSRHRTIFIAGRGDIFRDAHAGGRIGLSRVGLAALVAASAGMLNALWLRYAGPDTSLSFAIMLDILLMVVIGGMGTIYGAVIGATIFILAQNYLQALMGAASNAAADAGLPLLPGLLHPDRWLLWLGLLFIASVYFFPTGVVGRLRTRTRKPS